MLSQEQPAEILEMHRQGVSKHKIARVLKLSRNSVRKVLRANSSAVPPIARQEKAEPYRQQILGLLIQCKGNLVRVHEELTASGIAPSYAALTAFCRRHGIGQKPVVAASRYHL
ncbi:MAG: helix-turn-helix domain-containing protein [Bryobacterales bacterium]|nr:helix-turn-helix domain-containing protein [Bryobacterales bacterium]